MPRCKHKRLAGSCPHCKEIAPAPCSEAEIDVTTGAFLDGYLAGCDDPGFVTATVPEMISNPYPEGTADHANYKAGYITAIQ